MKKGFSLIEMLVVIGIIALLAAAILGATHGAMETARAAKCLSNLRSLASGAQLYAMGSVHSYPLAGSYDEVQTTDESADWQRGKSHTKEMPGWISWYSKDGQETYRSKATDGRVAEESWYTSAYCQDKERVEYCLTNGTLWTYVGCNRDVYRCPTHYNSAGPKPAWSYAMNGFFGWEVDTSGDPVNGIDNTSNSGAPFYSRGYAVGGADRILMFAELQFLAIDGEVPTRSESFDVTADPVLNVETPIYNSKQDGYGDECIGFNHKGSNLTYGHVVFADGHVEKLVYPRKGLPKEARVQLTKWLCNGVTVSFDGKEYKEFE